MTVLLSILGVVVVVAAWLAVYTHMGIIPEGAWQRLYARLFQLDDFKDAEGVDEEEEVFKDAFDMMSRLNVDKVESVIHNGKRTIYVICSRCHQKNRLGNEFKSFKRAGCGKCHANFASMEVYFMSTRFFWNHEDYKQYDNKQLGVGPVNHSDYDKFTPEYEDKREGVKPGTFHKIGLYQWISDHERSGGTLIVRLHEVGERQDSSSFFGDD
jgi:hypothetical protein